MAEYSERSKQLAQEVLQKALRNLERDSSTRRTPEPTRRSATPTTTQRATQ